MPKTSSSLLSASARRLAALAGLGHAGRASTSSSRTVPSMALPSQPQLDSPLPPLHRIYNSLERWIGVKYAHEQSGRQRELIAMLTRCKAGLLGTLHQLAPVHKQEGSAAPQRRGDTGPGCTAPQQGWPSCVCSP